MNRTKIICCLAGGILSFALLAGCGGAKANAVPQGSSTQTSRPSSQGTPSSSKTPTRLVSVGGLSLRVPATWTKGKQFFISRATATGFFLLPKVVHNPVSESGLTSNPKNKSAFFLEELQVGSENASLNLSELSAKEEFYDLRVRIPESQLPTLKKVKATVKTPPVATASDDVKFIKKASKADPGLLFETAQVGSSRWILTGGNPATAQEEFALFRSTDGGHTWTLAQSSFSRMDKSQFLGMAGEPKMLFWSSNDGIIVETSAFSPKILVFQTVDGGVKWTYQKLSPPSRPSGKTPNVTRTANGTLVVSAQLTSGKVFKASSDDGGKTWSPAR